MKTNGWTPKEKAVSSKISLREKVIGALQTLPSGETENYDGGRRQKDGESLQEFEVRLCVNICKEDKIFRSRTLVKALVTVLIQRCQQNFTRTGRSSGRKRENWCQTAPIDKKINTTATKK